MSYRNDLDAANLRIKQQEDKISSLKEKLSDKRKGAMFTMLNKLSGTPKKVITILMASMGVFSLLYGIYLTAFEDKKSVYIQRNEVCKSFCETKYQDEYLGYHTADRKDDSPEGEFSYGDYGYECKCIGSRISNDNNDDIFHKTFTLSNNRTVAKNIKEAKLGKGESLAKLIVNASWWAFYKVSEDVKAFKLIADKIYISIEHNTVDKTYSGNIDGNRMHEVQARKLYLMLRERQVWYMTNWSDEANKPTLKKKQEGHATVLLQEVIKIMNGRLELENPPLTKRRMK